MIRGGGFDWEKNREDPHAPSVPRECRGNRKLLVSSQNNARSLNRRFGCGILTLPLAIVALIEGTFLRDY